MSCRPEKEGLRVSQRDASVRMRNEGETGCFKEGTRSAQLPAMASGKLPCCLKGLECSSAGGAQSPFLEVGFDVETLDCGVGSEAR